MDYAETAPPPGLEGLIKARWTLKAGGEPGQWLDQMATPDGCVELIRRTQGQSRWDVDQPDCFIVGLVSQPQPFAVSGESVFEALRLWPWAWDVIGDRPITTLDGRWIAWPDQSLNSIEARLAEATGLNAIGRALVAAPTVAEMGEATGMNPRALQRWFARHVGMSPRAWLRLARFQKAFETVPGERSLAGHAADKGYADQAHMARTFRSLAGVSASTARKRGRGPFLG